MPTVYGCVFEIPFLISKISKITTLFFCDSHSVYLRKLNQKYDILV